MTSLAMFPELFSSRRESSFPVVFMRLYDLLRILRRTNWNVKPTHLGATESKFELEAVQKVVLNGRLEINQAKIRTLLNAANLYLHNRPLSKVITLRSQV